MEDRLAEYNPLLRVNARLTFHRPDDLKNIPYTSSDVLDVRGQERPSPSRPA
jgi:hypothetical protein